MNKIDKIIQIIRNIHEESPTMSSGQGGFTSEANPKGPVAGYDKLLDFRTKGGRVIKRQPIAALQAKKMRNNNV